jgi:magnesium chelatase subunit H
MITLLESQGIMPIPVFISGVEGHTVVRDLFTTDHEIMIRGKGFLGKG